MGNNFIRKEILEMGEFKVSDIKPRIKLDQNESPFRLPKSLRKKISRPLFDQYDENRYPQPSDYHERKSSAAEFLGTTSNRMAFTAGADQAILGSMMITGPKVLLLDPTYPIYANDALILNKKVSTFKLKAENDFTFEGLENEKDHDLVCLVSPNPPAGNLIPEQTIRTICQNNKCVVLDEAYFEISGVEHLDLLNEYENLVIIRTLSKACSLAGMRMGYLMAGNECFAPSVEKALFVPYNLSLMHYSILDNFAEIISWGKEYGARLKRTSERFQSCLKDIGVPFFPSQGNFILSALNGEHYEKLLKREIKTRLLSIDGEGFVRITVGTDKQMNEVLEVISSMV